MERYALLRPMVLAAILGAGFIMVWPVVVDVIAGVMEVMGDRERVSETLLFRPDGTPCVLRRTNDKYHDHEYRDLEGNPVPPPPETGFTWLPCIGLGANFSEAPAESISWDVRLGRALDGGTPPTVWYLQTQTGIDKTAYLIGYDSKSKHCIGYLGAQGFQQKPLEVREMFSVRSASYHSVAVCSQFVGGYVTIGGGPRIPEAMNEGQAPPGYVSPWDVYIVCRDGKLYRADLKKRTVQVVMEQPGLCSVGLRWLPHNSKQLVVRTNDEMLVLDDRGTILKRFPIPESLRDQAITFSDATTNGEAVMYRQGPRDKLATETDYHIYWVAPSGAYREAHTSLAFQEVSPTQMLQEGLGLPSPLVLGGRTAIGRTRELMLEGLASSYAEALRRAVTEYGPALVIAQLVAAGFAWLCYRRQVRYGASGRECVAWPLFVLAFGLPGWIGYRFGRTWPVLEACPTCGAAVPRDRVDCGRCDAEFPRAALKGTEVFA